MTCHTTIDRVGTRLYCEVCSKERRSQTWKIYNQKREGRKKTRLVCGICSDVFYVPGSKKYPVCYKSSCVSYFNSLKRKIKEIPGQVEKYQQSLHQCKYEYEKILRVSD